MSYYYEISEIKIKGLQMTLVEQRFEVSDLEELLSEKYDNIKHMNIFLSCVSDKHVVSLLISDDIAVKFTISVPYSVSASSRSKLEYEYNKQLYALFGQCVFKIDKALK